MSPKKRSALPMMGRVGGHGSLVAMARTCLYCHLNRKYIVNRSRQTANSRTRRTDIAETVLVSGC
ncbi:hypothetical protein J6590_063498 [Homalodisca vitripennis]|nr:hypothetical protein J6590_063498 [Homalodisca vitripennis]